MNQEFINWEDIEFKKTKGSEKCKCPKCIDSRSNKKDRSLYVRHDSGVAKCFYCDALSFRDSEEFDNSVSYTLPPQEWKNYTNLSDKLVKWAQDERSITQATLIHFGITEEKHYQPAHGKEVNNIVFNYFELDKLVNKKYRSGSKKFTQTTGGKPIFYNLNAIVGESEAYIVEGEFDVLAMYEAGIKNVISLPNGANDNDDYWKNSEKYLKDIERFIIAVDNDDKGKVVRDKIAHRLGRYRCEFIEWEGKDANDDLRTLKIENSIKQRKRFPVSGTFTVEDVYEDILELYDKGLPDTVYPKNDTFKELNEVFKLMMGHLIVGTGIPSHGKSSFSEWYILNLINDYDMKASFFSPEHSPMALHQANFIQKTVGKPFFSSNFEGVDRVTKTDIARYKDWANEKLYITLPEGKDVPTWDWIFNKFNEQIFNFGINIFVIDAFNKVVLNSGNKKDEIDTVLTRLTHFAQSNNVMVFLIAHPTKMAKKENGTYLMPDLYSVSGSSDFRNQTHDGFCVYRNFASDGGEDFTEIVNLKTKMSFQGEIGRGAAFEFDKPTGRYYRRGYQPDRRDLTQSCEPVQMEITEPKPMMQSREFDNKSTTGIYERLNAFEDDDTPF